MNLPLISCLLPQSLQVKPPQSAWDQQSFRKCSLHSVVCHVGGPSGPPAGIFPVRFPLGGGWGGTQNDHPAVTCVHPGTRVWGCAGCREVPLFSLLGRGFCPTVTFKGRKKQIWNEVSRTRCRSEGLFSSLITSEPYAFPRSR